MTDTPTKNYDHTRTKRSQKRRANLRAMGYTFAQVELSPLATGALNAMSIGTTESRSQIIERAILALYHKGA